MRCKCGYGFSSMAAKGKCEFDSYAVMREEEYQMFLESEVKVLGAQDKPSRLHAIARSSRYVGSGLVCPLCGRLLLVLPGDGPAVSYRPEESSSGETSQ